MLNIKNRKMHNFCINRGSLIDVDAAIYTLLINVHDLCHTSFKQTSILHRKILKIITALMTTKLRSFSKPTLESNQISMTICVKF